MIIVSITGPSMGEALEQMSASTPFADLFEVRLDVIRNPVVAELIAAAQRPVIATCRPAREGGGFTGGERERVEMLEAASLLGAAYVDLELSTAPRILKSFLDRRRDSAVILSAHRRVAGRAEAERLYRRLRSAGAAVVKLAFPVTDAADLGLVWHVLSLAARDRQKAVCIALGEAGEASRVLYRKLGGWGTYAAAETGPPAAAGQLRASVLRTVFRSDRLDRRSRVFGVVGNPLGQSRGVFVHNPLLHAAGKNAVYCRFPVVNLRRFMTDVAPLLHGFSVTIPHKEAILRYVDNADTAVRAIGAVNTMIRSASGWAGTNTDAPAALDAIENVCPVKGKTMLILGAGGAARAIVHEALRRGALPVVANRTAARGRSFAREFGIRCVPLAAAATTQYDILVNATSVGMVPDTQASPFPGTPRAGAVVFDAVYNPPITRLLRDAQRSGATIVPGTEMYLHQAARQFRLYNGIWPSARLMRRLLSEALRR